MWEDPICHNTCLGSFPVQGPPVLVLVASRCKGLQVWEDPTCHNTCFGSFPVQGPPSVGRACLSQYFFW